MILFFQEKKKDLHAMFASPCQILGDGRARVGELKVWATPNPTLRIGYLSYLSWLYKARVHVQILSNNTRERQKEDYFCDGSSYLLVTFGPEEEISPWFASITRLQFPLMALGPVNINTSILSK